MQWRVEMCLATPNSPATREFGFPVITCSNRPHGWASCLDKAVLLEKESSSHIPLPWENGAEVRWRIPNCKGSLSDKRQCNVPIFLDNIDIDLIQLGIPPIISALSLWTEYVREDFPAWEGATRARALLGQGPLIGPLLLFMPGPLWIGNGRNTDHCPETKHGLNKSHVTVISLQRFHDLCLHICGVMAKKLSRINRGQALTIEIWKIMMSDWSRSL